MYGASGSTVGACSAATSGGHVRAATTTLHAAPCTANSRGHAASAAHEASSAGPRGVAPKSRRTKRRIEEVAVADGFEDATWTWAAMSREVRHEPAGAGHAAPGFVRVRAAQRAGAAAAGRRQRAATTTGLGRASLVTDEGAVQPASNASRTRLLPQPGGPHSTYSPPLLPPSSTSHVSTAASRLRSGGTSSNTESINEHEG